MTMMLMMRRLSMTLPQRWACARVPVSRIALSAATVGVGAHVSALWVPPTAGMAVRTLRTRRTRRAPPAMAAEPVVEEDTRPVHRVPAFIRIRDFAKLIKQPVDSLVKMVAPRSHKRFHMEFDGAKYEFKTIKQVVLPFELAREIAHKLNKRVQFDDVEPRFHGDALRPRKTRQQQQEDQMWMRRNPVIAVMGHVDHGKTTLMDTLRQSNIAQFEVEGITQKINVCAAVLGQTQASTSPLTATFLDTPGHFHFFRMRTNAAQVADLVLLIVAADEGVLLQTEESIGAIEDAGIPVIACVNKVDVATSEQCDAVEHDLRGYVALQTCPMVRISGRTGQHLDQLKDVIVQTIEASPALAQRLNACVAPDGPIEGVVLESVAVKGRGNVLRVLLKHGVVKKHDHFVAGMIHGVVRSVNNADGEEIAKGVPGTVVDVMYKRLSKYMDAPIEFGFFVLPAERAKQVMLQRELKIELEEKAVPTDEEMKELRELAETEDGEEQGERANARASNDGMNNAALKSERVPAGFVEETQGNTRPIVVKADGAGSLTSIQDTVDEMTGISTVRLGIGDITTTDIDVASNSRCAIFGFNVKMRRRETKLAKARGVRVVLRPTVHGLIDEITKFEQEPRD